MNIDFSAVAHSKQEDARHVLDQLNKIDSAYSSGDKKLASTLCKENRAKITKSIEELIGTSLERQIEIGKFPNGVWLSTCYKVLSEFAEPFVPKNHFDQEFFELIKTTRATDYAGLFKIVWNSVSAFKKQYPKDYKRGFENYFSTFPLWGALNPERGDYEALKGRAVVLKQHSYDFVSLYRRFPDYLSKRTLTAILLNWLYIDTGELTEVKSIFPDYYEPDIFPDNKDDIFVDVGAYTGDSIQNYVKYYGTDYKKIYAYEITRNSCEKMSLNLKDLHDVEIRRKGVGEKAGEMFLSASASDPSANQISDGASGEHIDIVALDDDIPEGFTFLKMDIEGAEYNAIKGCEQIIRRCRPKLAICVYHGYDDIWRIPALIDRIEPNYTFYLRHNGGNLVPTEFVLLCKPDEK